MLKNIQLFLPELVLVIATVFMVIVSLFIPNNDKDYKKKEIKISRVITILAIISSFAILLFQSGMVKIFNDFIIIDAFSRNFKLIFLFIALISILFISISRETKDFSMDFYILFIVTLIGMMLLVSSNNLLAVYLGIEMLSIPAYLMTAWKRKGKGIEAAIKYTVYGGVASGIMLFGLSLIYGLTSSMNFSALLNPSITNNNQALWIIAVLLVIAGFSYKIAAVPFHHWSPDVYQGATTALTSFFSVGPKAAGFALLIRFFYVGSPSGARHVLTTLNWTWIIALIAVLSMFVGNLSALKQTSFKRMLAYSSIAHAGYILSASVASSSLAIKSMMFYIVVYALMNIGAFMVADIIIEKKGTDNIEGFKGLASVNPALSLMMAFFMFSLIGIPPFGGFVGKVYIFYALIKEASFLSYSLVIFGVINTVISVYYYMRIVKFIYMDKSDKNEEISCNLYSKIIILSLSILVIFTGLYWEPLVNFLTSSIIY